MLIVTGGILLVACGDNGLLDRNPGTYDGPRDPLTDQSAAARADLLAERFVLIQAPPGRTMGEDENAPE